MPTKLESLKAERKRLSTKKNLSPQEDARLQSVDRQIRQEERKHDPTPGKIYRQTTVSKTGRRADDGARWGTSTAQAATRDQLRTQFGMAPLGDLIVENRDTGEIGLDPAVAKMRFGPQPSRPGLTGRATSVASAGLKAAYANTPGNRNVAGMNSMSAKDLLDFYYSMNDAELVKFQTELVEAGFFEDGKPPTFAMRDPATTEALGTLMRLWMNEPDTPIQDLLKKMKQANARRLDEKIREQFGGSGTGVVSDEIANITVTDAETLNSIVDQLSTELMGSFVDPDTKAALVKKIQDTEAARKTGLAQADFGAKTANSAQGGAAGELDAFMNALIGQESGGSASAVNADSGAMGLGQIMPENWGPWAAEAGANPGDFSEANQRKVIKYKLAQYYQAYGNWRDVAIAWYGGGGGVERARAGGGNNIEYYDGAAYPSLNAYADSVLAQMKTATGDMLAAGRQPQLQVNVMEDLADPRTQVENELRRLDPAKYQATKVAKNAEVFFNLLGGVN